MNTKSLLQTSLIIALVAVATLIVIILQMRSASNREVAALNQRLSEVEKELSKSRLGLAPVSNLRSNPPVVRRYTLDKRTPSPVPPAVESPKRSGKVWGEGEVNGWKYQDIPL